jgi:hypothetical protein
MFLLWIASLCSIKRKSKIWVPGSWYYPDIGVMSEQYWREYI